MQEVLRMESGLTSSVPVKTSAASSLARWCLHHWFLLGLRVRHMRQKGKWMWWCRMQLPDVTELQIVALGALLFHFGALLHCADGTPGFGSRKLSLSGPSLSYIKSGLSYTK